MHFQVTSPRAQGKDDRGGDVSQHLGSLFSRTVSSSLPGLGFPLSTSNLNKPIAD